MRVRVQKRYLAESSGKFATCEIGGGGGGERDAVTELIQGDVFLNVLSELNPKRERKGIRGLEESGREETLSLDSRYLSPGSPLAAMSLWESRSMILSSLDLWTRMLCTADESATTIANPLPTNPNTHSITLSSSSLCQAPKKVLYVQAKVSINFYLYQNHICFVP